VWHLHHFAGLELTERQKMLFLENGLNECKKKNNTSVVIVETLLMWVLIVVFY